MRVTLTGLGKKVVARGYLTFWFIIGFVDILWTDVWKGEWEEWEE